MSVCAVWWNSRMSLSANRFLCLTRTERAALTGPAVPHLCLCLWKRMCARVLTNHSDLSAVISASNSPAQRTRSESMLIYLHLFSCLPLSSLTVHAFHLLPCFTPLITSYFSVIVFLLTPSLPVTSCHCLISSPFFLSPPLPPLCFLSSFSHAPVGEYNEMATAGLCGAVRCVCLCDVTLQQLHSGSLFFNPHAHRPHCYFKIL